MRPAKKGQSVGSFLWDLLTFERLLTGPVLHLIYWAGLGLIVVLCFGIISGSVAMSIREGAMGILLGFAALVIGLLLMAALILLWRLLCEFYVAVFRISDDLRALRRQSDGQQQDDNSNSFM